MTEYITSTALKATLSLTGETFADDDISAAIAAASRAIDNYCGRWFAETSGTGTPAAETTRYYQPVSTQLIYIDDLYSFTSLDTDDDGDGTFETSWTLNTDFVLEPVNAAADNWPWTRIRLHPRHTTGFPAGYPRSVKLVGYFGWASVPDAVVEACTILAAKLLRRSREAPFGIVSVGIDGGAARISSQDPDVRFMLAPYVREKA